MKPGHSFATGLSQERLRQILHYDPEAGIFLTKALIAKGQPIPPGTEAGHTTKAGYRRIVIGGVAYLAHRLAWLYVYGEWPKTFLDHKNGIRSDNRICNLREATKMQNCQNRKHANSNNRSGWMGATYRPRQGWVCQIGVGNQTYLLGYFEDPEPAHLLYLWAKQDLHFGGLDFA